MGWVGGKVGGRAAGRRQLCQQRAGTQGRLATSWLKRPLAAILHGSPLRGQRPSSPAFLSPPSRSNVVHVYWIGRIAGPRGRRGGGAARGAAGRRGSRDRQGRAARREHLHQWLLLVGREDRRAAARVSARPRDARADVAWPARGGKACQSRAFAASLRPAGRASCHRSHRRPGPA